MIEWLHGWVWGPGMLALFLFVGVLYTVRLRGYAFFGFFKWWKVTVGSLFGKHADSAGHGKADTPGSDEREISQFQSACTALAATIGTGNIAGVATALLAGGPGAIFWMWVSAFLGMATAYGETELGIRYRRKDREGNWLSGAMIYLERGLHCRWAAVIYAGLCMMASFGMGSMVQANAIAETFSFAFSLPPAVIGVVLTALVARILVGGAASIARAAEKLVPFSAGIYMVSSILIVLLFYDRLPMAFGMILRDAFAFDSAAGGVVGFTISKAVRFGVARGVFSNEAGLGSMAALNGGAEHTEPGVQGQWGMFEVFFDTIVCCTLTAMVILCTAGNELAEFTGNGAELTTLCFTRGLGDPGGYLMSMSVAMFAFATIIAWFYMGRQAVVYIGETVGCSVSKLYLIGYLGCTFFGCLGSMETVWEISDIFNGLMALPNLMALILLAGQVKRPEPQ